MGRRPPPAYRGPRHHRSRLPLVILLLVTLAVGGYLVVTRQGSSSTSGSDFAQTTTHLVTVAEAVPVAAQKVQRFLELPTFDADAQAALGKMQGSVRQLQTIARASSGPARQIADNAVTAGNRAIDAVGRFRQAVVYSYRLSNASAAEQDLAGAVATLHRDINEWAHHS